MQFILSGEMYVRTGIAELNHKYIDCIMEYFQQKRYSPAMNKVAVFFICRPGGPYKQRKKFDHQNGIFYTDIMLDYPFVMQAGAQEKEKYYLDSFRQIFPILEKYKNKIIDFRFDEFKDDLESLLNQWHSAIL